MSKLKSIRFPPPLPPSPCVFFYEQREVVEALVQSRNLWKRAASAYERRLAASILPDFGSRDSQAKAFHVHT